MDPFPSRLLDPNCSTDDLARDLLLAGQDSDLSSEAAARKSKLIVLGVAGVPAGLGAFLLNMSEAAAAVGKVSAWPVALKVGAGAAIGVGIAAVSYTLALPPDSETEANVTASVQASPAVVQQVTKPSVTSAKPDKPARVGIEMEALAPDVRKPARVPAQPETAPAPSGPGSIAEELAALKVAQDHLNAGQPSDALSALSEYRKRFPKGSLATEAEVIAIDALARSGRIAEARRRADRFLERAGNSPQSVRIRAIRDRLGGP